MGPLDRRHERGPDQASQRQHGSRLRLGRRVRSSVCICWKPVYCSEHFRAMSAELTKVRICSCSALANPNWHCSATINTVPLKPQTDGTSAVYAADWARLLSFILQSLELSEAERRFSLTPEQDEKMRALLAMLQEGTSTREEKRAAIIDATYALLVQELTRLPQSEQHPIMTFIILSNVTLGNHIAAPENVSPTLAPVQFILRAALLCHMISIANASGGAISLFQTLKTELQWVKEGEDTIFAWLRQTGHLTAYWAHQATRMPRFKWETSQTHFWYNGQNLALTDFKTMLSSSVDTLGDILNELSTFYNLPKDLFVSLDELKTMGDHQDKRSENYCFLDDVGNAAFKDRAKNIVKHMVDNCHICTRVEGELVWSPGRVRAAMELSERFLNQLILVMYLTGGQPPRGSELTHALYRNLSTRIRNIYVELGSLVNVGFLNKTSYTHNADKPIPRGFPPIISFILTNYLLFVRPLEHFISLENRTTQSVDDINKCYTHLFHLNGAGWVTENLTASLKTATENYMHARGGFGTKDMRQILISIATHCVTTQERGDGYRARTDLQGGHISALARIHYGVEFGRLSPNLTQEVMDDFLQISKDHHIAFGLVEPHAYDRPPVILPQEVRTTACLTCSHLTDYAAQAQLVLRPVAPVEVVVVPAHPQRLMPAFNMLREPVPAIDEDYAYNVSTCIDSIKAPLDLRRVG